MGFGTNRYLIILMFMGVGLVGCSDSGNKKSSRSSAIAASTSGISPTTSSSTNGVGPLLLSAELFDTDGDQRASKGDQLVLGFDAEIAPIISGNTIDPANEFSLAVGSDDLGLGASLSSGSNSREVAITLGDAPIMQVSGSFDSLWTSPGSASGINIASTGSGKITGLGTAAVGTAAVVAAASDLDVDSALQPAFSPATSLNVARGGHTAVLLDDGRVLVVGGIAGGSGETYVAEAELFDPVTEDFSMAGTMKRDGVNVRMVSATATKLKDGKVLICGGYGVEKQKRAFLFFGKKKDKIDTLKSAFVFDPATNAFARVGDMKESRHSHTASLMDDGRVLIAGGFNDDVWKKRKAEASFETFDPKTGKFSKIGAAFLGLGGLKTEDPRLAHTATPIEGGAGILFTGGQRFSGGGLFGLLKPKAKLNKGSEVIRDAKTVADSVSLNDPRMHHGAASLDTTSVLVAGGQTTNAVIDTLEIYDATATAWTRAGKLSTARTGVEVVKAGRHALVIGGHDGNGESSAVDLFDLNSQQVTGAIALNTARNSFTATTLQDGSVLVIGGMTGATKSLQSLDGQALSSCERYVRP